MKTYAEVFAQKDECAVLFFDLVSSIPAMINIPENANWTYAATFGINSPQGLDFDSNDTLYIAAGNGLNMLAPGMTYPVGMNYQHLPNNVAFQDACDIFSSFNGSLYVVDYQTQWILTFLPNFTHGDNIFNNLQGPVAIFVTPNETIYVSDQQDDQVRLYSTANTVGQVAAGRNNEGSGADQLKNPRGIFVDEEFNLYIADKSNNRIQKWSAGATDGVTVAGNKNGNSGNSMSCLNEPTSVIVDRIGRLYVADTKNDRVVRWLPNATSGYCIISCSSAGVSGQGKLEEPTSLKFDSHGNLYVSEQTKNRIQKFTISHAASPSKLILFKQYPQLVY